MDRSALPRSAERVFEVEVDFRTVERAVALVYRVRKTEFVERGDKSLRSRLPVLVAAHTVFGAGGKFDRILESEFSVDLVDKVNDSDDLVGDLLARHKDMCVVLRKATNAEKPVERTFEFVTMNESEFAHSHRKFAITMGLGAVNHNAARAVHRLDAINFVVDDRRVHIVFVVIPVTARFPEMTIHDKRRRNLYVTVTVMDFAPVVDKRVFDSHTLRQEERESGGFVAKHKQAHFLTDAAMIAFFSLFEHANVIVEFLLSPERSTLKRG